MIISILSEPVKVKKQRSKIIKLAKDSPNIYDFYLADGSVERYFGTLANKRGYAKKTYRKWTFSIPENFTKIL